MVGKLLLPFNEIIFDNKKFGNDVNIPQTVEPVFVPSLPATANVAVLFIHTDDQEYGSDVVGVENVTP